MNAGFDLDDTVYAYPDIFKAIITALHAAGHKIFCTSAHSKVQFEKEDRPRLSKLGIDPGIFDVSLLGDKLGLGTDGVMHKARMATACDFVFDDHADLFQKLTATPIFKVPVKK